jgi:hypothetical protein
MHNGWHNYKHHSYQWHGVEGKYRVKKQHVSFKNSITTEDMSSKEQVVQYHGALPT